MDKVETQAGYELKFINAVEDIAFGGAGIFAWFRFIRLTINIL
ncbi:MAG: hypothetical protein V1897_14345 [Pseudomonadota bacterium]